jgi:preprotein translocase subunit SecG
MTFIVGILTFIIVLNALLLILLVLVQLPKKDAGAGMAFGAGTADALFGAGSGNALTKITKYSVVVFLLLALFLGYLHDKIHADNTASDFAAQVQQKQMQSPAIQAPPVQTPPTTAPVAPPSANNLLSTLPVQTNAPASK